MANTGEDRPPLELNLSETLLSLQSTSTSTRRARPPPMGIYIGPPEENRIPLKQPKVQRRESKGGLRSLFTRNRVEKLTAFPVREEEAPAPGISERSMRVMAEAGLRRSMSIRRFKTVTESVPTLPATPVTPATPIRSTSRSSRVNFRTKQTKTPSKSSPKSTKSASKSATRRSSACWDPPPLFQAYPQAIKHSQLTASTLSTDAILRISKQKTNTLRDEIAHARMGNAVGQTANAKKSEKTRAKHRRQLSGSISKADWTQKIFVLVTSGYLLQYAGEGSFDRLPEKMMQLGKDSVAFASDVIPGKHWVLQISQAMDADGTPAADARSLLSRLAFRGADYRRTATSLLLVLNSAEDMDSWLAVVRREIEALGGKKHVSETGKPKPDDKVMQLKAQPSHRYLVTRDPDQAHEPSSPLLPSLWIKEKDNQLQRQLDDAVNAITSTPLPSIRPSTGEDSIANSVMSHGERQLDNLRDGSHRFSYMSSGQRTLITSQGSSPATSPTRDSAPSFDDLLPKLEESGATPRPNAADAERRRRSMQTIQTSALEAPALPKNYRHSTYGGPTRNVRSPSPAAPNFTVPNSSRKCYSKSQDANAPPLPFLTKSSASQSREPSLKRVTPRSLSPVKDAHSPKQESVVAPLSDTSVTTTIQYEIPTNDEQPSPTVVIPSYTDAPTSRRHRESSIMPINAPNKALADFQFPRRFSSMQTLRDVKGEQETREAPFKRNAPAPIPMDLLPDLPSTPEDEVKESHEMGRKCITPTPAIANIKTKVWRPISMQVGITNKSSQSLARSATPNSLSKSTPSNYTISKTIVQPPASPLSPTLSIVPAFAPNSGRPITPSFNEDDGSLMPGTILSPPAGKSRGGSRKGGQKTLGNRRSMPTLVNGPPPAPPPDCALPPLPPAHAGRDGVRSPGSYRSRSALRF